MTRSFRYHLGWIAVVLLILLLAALVPLWLWSRERAIAREKAEKAAVAALELLARLQTDFRQRDLDDDGKLNYWTGGVSDFLGHMQITTVHHSNPMMPMWDEIYQGDVRGKARPTSYGYLFEALPAKGFAFKAYPAKDMSLRTFVVDEEGLTSAGEVIAK